MVSVYDLQVLCESCEGAVQLERPDGQRKFGAIGGLILGAIGFIFGLTIGVATAGFGFAAWPFLTVIGLYVGYRAGLWSAEKKNGVTCPECDGQIA